MLNLKKKVVSLAAATTLMLGSLPAFASADGNQSSNVSIPQGTGQAVLDNANYFGDLPPSTELDVDIVMKVHHESALTHYIKGTTTANSHFFRKYLSVSQFSRLFAPSKSETATVTNYLKHFGISSKVYPDHLVITAHGTVAEFNKAFNVRIKHAKFKGRKFHGTRRNPKAPSRVAHDILAILGLSDYSNFVSNAKKRAVNIKSTSSQEGPLSLDPSALIKHYNVQPLYNKGATGKGQTIGIVTLAEFNPQDAYTFWKKEGINVKPNRIHVSQVDGGSGWSGYDETSLDVEQSGALAPQADINVYVGPNTDPGFVDAFAKAINDNVANQISASWGLSETAITDAVKAKTESPEYAQVFNQLFMEAAAQGISMFSSAGDSGAYDAVRYPGTFQLSADNPADSPYITAAGGTTLPWHTTTSTGVKVNVSKERAWGWDYLYPFFDSLGLYYPNSPYLSYYFSGGGGGISNIFKTPDYQKGVKGVNHYTGVKYWQPNSDFTSVTRLDQPQVVSGKGNGRNLPDLSMNADPYTGYKVYFSDPGKPGQNGGFSVYGGTSFVAPQLNGLSALMNSAYHMNIGFWNPQIYRFAQQKNSPFNPLNTTGTNNDNIFYTGTKGTIYNQATGLGIPDIASLAKMFASEDSHHGPGNGWHHHGNH